MGAGEKKDPERKSAFSVSGLFPFQLPRLPSFIFVVPLPVFSFSSSSSLRSHKYLCSEMPRGSLKKYPEDEESDWAKGAETWRRF